MIDDQPLSIIAGPPLADEPGIGALTLGGYLAEVTTAFAEREALVMHEPTGVTRWTYAELWEQANNAARALIASGVSKGTRVGVLMTNRPEFLAAVFGTALAGGIAVTLSTFSTSNELEFLLQESACSVILVERRILKKDFVAYMTGFDPAMMNEEPGCLASVKFPFLRHIVAVGGGDEAAVEDWADFLARGDGVKQGLVDARAAAVAPADPGVIFFSSGSTAKPKGILSSHRGPALQLWRWKRFLAAGDDVRAWSANGFFWSGNFCMALGAALSSGGSLVLQATFQPEEALSLMERERATMAIAWPHQWTQFEAASNWLEVDLSSLHYVGAPTPLGRHPTVSTDWQEPLAAYGNTETFTISAIFESGTPEERIGSSHGEPLPGNIFKIVAPLTGEVVPLGERGEIAVKGPTMMLGYLGVPLDRTLDAEGFFRTGDGGYFDTEGRLYWEGRLNDIIKTGGANVSPVEIDAVLQSCPGVKVAQTVGIPHETLGELVVTCIVPHADAAIVEDDVRRYAKERLASYKVPRRVLFFAEEQLALTGSSKIKTADLKKLVTRELETAEPD